MSVIAVEKENKANIREELAGVLAIDNLPDAFWIHDDDLCDCTFQRIGQWTNPYLAETLEVRLCCLWRELYKMFPEFIRDIPAYYNSNTHEWVVEPAPWDSEDSDMPLPIWYRQLAKQTGKSLADIRTEYQYRIKERPHKTTNKRQTQPTTRSVEAARLARMKLTGWL